MGKGIDNPLWSKESISLFTSDSAEREAQKKLVQERRDAAAQMAYDLANLHMPEDLKSRAAAWGIGNLMELVWNSAFQAGYRQARRALKEGQEDG
jgi:hypothetical protein